MIRIRRRAAMAIALFLLLGSARLVWSQGSGNDEADAMRALDAFLDGWNSRDVRKYASALHFPHVFLEAGTVRMFADEAQFFAVGADHWAGVQPEWDHTVWEERKVIQRIGDTIHIAGRWARLDKSGKVLSKADVMYVVVKKNGRWALFTRSGSRAAQGSPQPRGYQPPPIVPAR